MLNIIIQIAVAVLLLWASFRALRAENRFLKWVGGGLSALLGAAANSATRCRGVRLEKWTMRSSQQFTSI